MQIIITKNQTFSYFFNLNKYMDLKGKITKFCTFCFFSQIKNIRTSIKIHVNENFVNGIKI
jgi:hypothetical protein